MIIGSIQNRQKLTYYEGVGDGIMQVDENGNVSANEAIEVGKLSDVTTQNLLKDIANWNDGTYTGTTITGTSEGQYYADSKYFFYAYSDNSWIRISIKPSISIIIACSDVATACAAGAKKAVFPAPYDFDLNDIFGFLDTVCTGSTFIIDVNKNGTTVLSTKLSIDASEHSSLTAATPKVISVTSFTKGDIISFDFDQVGATIAGAGCLVVMDITKS